MIASDIITSAFREGNLIPIGASPNTAEQTEALQKLNALIRRLFGSDVGEHLMEWPVPPPQRTDGVAARFPQAPGACDLPAGVWPSPPCNVRLVSSITSATTIYLQHFPNDGARVDIYGLTSMSGTLTVDGNGRTVSGALTQAWQKADLPKKLFYRGDLADWIVVADLAAGDTLPFPDDFEDYFTCALSIALSPRFGKMPGSATVEGRDRGLKDIHARYRQPTAVLSDGPNIRETEQTYYGRNRNWMV